MISSLRKSSCVSVCCAGVNRLSAPFAAVAVAYTVIYFLAFPGGKNYYHLGAAALAKAGVAAKAS